jgi:hypothetical protein
VGLKVCDDIYYLAPKKCTISNSKCNLYPLGQSQMIMGMFNKINERVEMLK